MIKIQKSKRQKMANTCGDLENDPSYLPINLKDYWEDTLVRQVFIHRQCQQAIFEWVERSKRHNVVPEVGGFLLGCYKKLGNQSYMLGLEVFIPAREIEYNSPVLLEFGTKALVNLDRERDKFPDKQLVGWFHTHPGHTPFLSGTDLSLHNSFFKQNHQIAVVLDCLTKDYDTGIFARKTNGEMNNKEAFSKWLKWKAL